MIYIICPSCKKCLGDIQEQYEKILSEICKDVDSKNITKEKGDELKQKLILSFNLNYCCNTRILTYVNLVDIIV